MINIWKSYLGTEGWRIKWKKTIAVNRCNFCSSKGKPKKIQACTGFEPLTSVILVQCSTNWANNPTGCRSELVCYTCKPLDGWQWNNENIKIIFSIHKHQLNTRWAFVWKHDTFTHGNNMLSSHAERSSLLWLHDQSCLSQQKLLKWNGLVFNWHLLHK